MSLPSHVERALGDVFGQPVDGVRIVPNSWYVRFHRGMCATTRRNRILLRGGLEDFVADPALLLHEYYHVLRQWQTRRLTPLKYLMESLRRGYWRNRFEVEAREFTDAQLPRFRRLLHGSPERQ